MGVNIMLLEPPLSVIETLKERIAVHGASLLENETRLGGFVCGGAGYGYVQNEFFYQGHGFESSIQLPVTAIGHPCVCNPLLNAIARSTGLVWDGQIMPSEVSGTNQPQL